MWIILAFCLLSAVVIMFGLVICYLAAELNNAAKRENDLEAELRNVRNECRRLEIELAPYARPVQ